MSKYKPCDTCEEGMRPKRYRQHWFHKACPDCKRDVGFAVGRLRDMGVLAVCVNPKTPTETAMNWLAGSSLIALIVLAATEFL